MYFNFNAMYFINILLFILHFITNVKILEELLKHNYVNATHENDYFINELTFM